MIFSLDTLIKDGDFALNNNGLPIQIGDISAIIQRATIRLSIKQGSFLYDPYLGSNLHILDFNSVDDFTIISTISAALAPIPDISVISIEKNKPPSPDGTFYLTVFISIFGQQHSLSISI